MIGVNKKTWKTDQTEKIKKNRKNWAVKKNRLNRLEFWKNRPVRFASVSVLQVWNRKNQTEPKPKKTEQNRKKTEPNRFEPVFVLKNRTELKAIGLNRFWFFKKKICLIIFFYKNRTEPKIITPTWWY